MVVFEPCALDELVGFIVVDIVAAREALFVGMAVALVEVGVDVEVIEGTIVLVESLNVVVAGAVKPSVDLYIVGDVRVEVVADLESVGKVVIVKAVVVGACAIGEDKVIVEDVIVVNTDAIVEAKVVLSGVNTVLVEAFVVVEDAV